MDRSSSKRPPIHERQSGNWMKNKAPLRVMCDRDGALVLLDDAVRNREAKTRSSTYLLCREEWIEDALFVSGWYAWACITKTNLPHIRLRRTVIVIALRAALAIVSRALVSRL